MKTVLILLIGFSNSALLGAPFPKHRIGEELLRQKLVDVFTQDARVEILNFSARGKIPEDATLSALHPEIPMGQVQAEFIWRERGETKLLLATAVVRVYSKVLVAHSDVSSNEPFTEANTRFEERELSPLRVSGYFTHSNELQDYRARGFIPHGTVIGHLQIAKPVLIQPGQMIDLTYSKGKVKIIAKVRALERGIYNQWIRVENPATKRVLQGRVTEFGQASVH